MAFAEARHAIELDPQESRCHRVLSSTCLYRRDYEMAQHHVQRALDLNPNDADAMMTKGRILALRDSPGEGLSCMEAAARLNPMYPPFHNSFFGIALYSLRRFGDAAQAFKRMPNAGPWGATWSLARLAACYAQLGLTAETKAAVAEVLRLKPDFSTSEFMSKSVLLEHAEDRELLREGLIKAGLPA
jgi:tetratricopeptide (TPR) repeat protein